MKKSVIAVITSLVGMSLLGGAAPLAAAEFEIDPAHSFVEFRINHIGFSWLYGRFNTLSGEFTHDGANPDASAIMVEIDPASVDTNHAERDKHLRSEDFLDVEKYPQASFKSTKYVGDEQSGTLEGELTLHGVTKPIKIDVEKIGEGPDPWGGHRAGFSGTTTLAWKDFGIEYDLGPAADLMELTLGIEGIRQ